MTDVPGLTPITGTPSAGADVSRLKSDKNLKAAGDRFEAIFTGMMMKAMRSTHLADDLFGSKAGDTFREMQDQKTAEAMAAHAPLGIGKAMTDFLSRSQAAPAAGGAAKGDVNHDPPQTTP